MRCPICSTENSASADACHACGAALSSGMQAVAVHTLATGTGLQGGSFSIGKVLGQGGFGITYLGSDVRLRRPVAIKELFPTGCVRQRTTVHPAGAMTVADYQAAKQRFLDEALVLAQFQHPGIVHVYASFEENNTAYMVMEFLKGKTLLKLVEERGAIPEREAVSYVKSVGEALAVMHQAKLLHRDIKPENVIATDDGRIVLVDFGTAREFAAGKTKRMTAMLTPGYSPLEQYGQHARFGIFTDVYALGATLYHLLTGQIPVQATDRASGVELVAPDRLNARISRTVSDAVMWAMEMRADRRPQSVGDFLSALQGGGGGIPTTGADQEAASFVVDVGIHAPEGRPAIGARDRRRRSPPGSTAPSTNPYEGRMQQVLAELTRRTSAPTSQHDKRINEINSRLLAIARFPVPESTQCPACLKTNFTEIKGEVTRQCPLCGTGGLRIRKLDLEKCPVCHEGRLAEQQLSAPVMFCPICRVALLQEERRKRFGLALDLWWICPHCRAEIDVRLGSGARLVSYCEDPYGFGKQHQGRTLSLAAWEHLAPRSDRRWSCGTCDATFHQRDDKSLTLVRFTKDPHGLGGRNLYKTLLRVGWAKLAQDLQGGNVFCSHCRAELDYDEGTRTFCLVQSGSRVPAWAQQVAGKPLPLQSWYAGAAGKRSLQPGWLCSACKAEFDSEPTGLRLVWALGPLSGRVNLTYSQEDWHRIAAGLPSSSEEKQLRDELADLASRKQLELRELAVRQAQRRSQLEAELTKLVNWRHLAALSA